MRITLCGSASLAPQISKIKEELERRGHRVFVFPDTVNFRGKEISITEFYRLRREDPENEEYRALKGRLMREHFERIKRSDAILVVNVDKNGVEGYIGGNTLIEMGVAFFLGKKIFLWKKPPKDLSYYEEVVSMEPVVIEGDLNRIK